jgi:tetratricopeptide (TPR) repeat protein
VLNTYSDDREDIKYIQKLYENKYYDMSVEELESFLIKYPNSRYYDTAIYLLANSYYIEAKLPEAEKNYKKLLNTDFSDRAYFYLVQIYLKTDRGELAEKQFRGISRNSNYREVATYDMAQYFYKKNNLIKAEKYFKSAVSLNGKNKIQSLLNLGIISYNRQDYFKAIVYLEEFLVFNKKTDENTARVNYLLGVSYKENEELIGAIDYYLIVENDYKDSLYYPETLRDLMLVYKEIKDYDEFVKYVNKLENSKYEKFAFTLAADHFSDARDYDNAEKYYSAILAKKEDEDIRFKYSVVLLSNKKKDKALESFKKLNGTKYKNEYLYYTSFLEYENANYAEVVSVLKGYDKNGEEIKYSDDLNLFLSESAYQQKDYSLARRYYRKVYAANSNLINLYKLVLVNSKLADLDELGKLYNEYNNKFPEDRKYKKDIYVIVGNLYVQNNDLNKGEEIYKRFLKKQEDSLIIENLITVLLIKGSYEELLVYIDKQDPTNENIYIKGIASLGVADFNEAEKAFLYLTKQDELNKEDKEKATVKLIETYLTSQKYDKLINTAEKYEKNNYALNKIEVERSKAIAYFRLKQYGSARNVYLKLAKQEEYKDNSNFMIAETYYNEKDYVNAKKYYENTIATTNNKELRESANYWLINIGYINKDYEITVDKITDFETEFPKSEYKEDLSYVKASIFLTLNRAEEAIKEYEDIYASSTDPRKKESTAKKVMELYYETGDTQNALTWNDKVKDKSYKTLYKGLIYEKAGNVELASKEYLKLVKNDKYGDLANYNLGNYYYQKQDYKNAMTHYSVVVKSEVSQVKDKAQFRIGEIYEVEGNQKKAISAYLRIKLLYTDSDFQDLVLVKLGELYESIGDLDKAVLNYHEYFDAYKSGSDYSYITEKLLAYYINQENMVIAENFYVILKETDNDSSKKYAEFFKK